MLSTRKRVWLLNVIAQFFSAIEGGQSTHNNRTQQHAKTGQSKPQVAQAHYESPEQHHPT